VDCWARLPYAAASVVEAMTAAWECEKVSYPTRAGFWDSLWRLLRGERLERWVEVCAECGDYGEGCKSCGR
jgi:hypothetical protein